MCFTGSQRFECAKTHLVNNTSFMPPGRIDIKEHKQHSWESKSVGYRMSNIMWRQHAHTYWRLLRISANMLMTVPYPLTLSESMQVWLPFLIFDITFKIYHMSNINWRLVAHILCDFRVGRVRYFAWWFHRTYIELLLLLFSAQPTYVWWVF